MKLAKTVQMLDPPLQLLHEPLHLDVKVLVDLDRDLQRKLEVLNPAAAGQAVCTCGYEVASSSCTQLVRLECCNAIAASRRQLQQRQYMHQHNNW